MAFPEEEMNHSERKTEPKAKKTPKPDLKKRGEKTADACMRCGAPVEREGDLLCRKCDGEVH
jgi:hypothetical protein